MADNKWKNWSELENVKGTNASKNINEMFPDFADMLSYVQSYPD